MEIEIRFKLKNNSDSFNFSLTPEQYYDMINDNETYEEDGVPKFDEAKGYLTSFDNSISLDTVEQAIIEIKNSNDNDHTIKTFYLGQGSSLIIHREDKNGYELIIQSIKIANNCAVVTRMDRNDSSSDWRISSSIGLNCELENIGEEKWYSVINGEFINGNISE